MKALILAGGRGTRLRPITYSIAKQLVPVANKPVIEYSIEALKEAGLTEFGIVVGDSWREIESALGDGSRWGVQFTYVKQEAPLGLAHAVQTAQDYLNGDTFVVFLGDNLIKGGVKEIVGEFRANPCDASILLSRVPNPQEFGVAELSGDRVVRLVEKPAEPKSDLALVGVYLFSPVVFDAIKTLRPSFRGEYEITDAIQTLIDWGREVRYKVITGWWKDTGTVEAILEANRLILEDLSGHLDGVVEDSRIEGPVRVGVGSVIRRSVLRGPVIIGAHCLVEDAYVGPFTSLSDGVQVKNAEIEYSIVMNDSFIQDVATRISGSLLGRGVRVSRALQKPTTVRLVLGDHSDVILS